MNNNIVLNEELLLSYSDKYNISIYEMYLIFLNRYGVISNIPDKRIRFHIKLKNKKEIFYVAICVNTFDSPFKLKGEKLYFFDHEIAEVFNIEEDTCDTTYFRNNKKELTLNSNSRSSCKGCSFCGTYNLHSDDKMNLSSKYLLKKYLENLLIQNNLNDFKDLERVTVCTGCFKDDFNLVEHLKMVYDSLTDLNFNGTIRYIGSQIKTTETMERISFVIPNFYLSLTVECFTNRNERLKSEKGILDLNNIKEILNNSISHGFKTNYLYIVGLDDLANLESGINELHPFINDFPVFQIMQNYETFHEEERSEQGRTIDYYLKARKIIENTFKTDKYYPKLWENYRGLFYYSYNNNLLTGTKI